MANADNLDIREGLKKPFLQKSKPVNTGAPARFLSKKMGFFRGYLV
ncbi:Response regulator/sensor histidine kinase, partial [Pseudomonas cannabina]